MKFEREEGFFLGAFTMNFAVMMLSVGLFIGVSIAVTYPDPPAVKLAVIGVFVAVLIPVLFYPVSRTLWSAVDLLMKPLEPQEVAAATEARGDAVTPTAPGP
jgi:hypothetical protein